MYGRAVVVLAVPPRGGDPQRALHRHAPDGAVLELVAELAVRRRVAVLVEHAQADQQPALGIVGAGGRLGAAVVEVARRARLGVEQRAEPVAALGGGRGGDPVVVEEVVADREVAALLAVEAGHRLGEGAVAGDLDGGVAALVGQLLVGRGRADAVGVVPSSVQREQQEGEWRRPPRPRGTAAAPLA